MDEVSLELQRYAISYLLSKEVVFDNVTVDRTLNDIAYRLTVTQRIPTKILQDKAVICSHPRNNWEWFKSLFGLKHNRTYYTFSEHVTFPNLKWPEQISKDYKIFLEKGIFNEASNYHVSQ